MLAQEEDLKIVVLAGSRPNQMRSRSTDHTWARRKKSMSAIVAGQVPSRDTRSGNRTGAGYWEPRCRPRIHFSHGTGCVLLSGLAVDGPQHARTRTRCTRGCPMANVAHLPLPTNTMTHRSCTKVRKLLPFEAAYAARCSAVVACPGRRYGQRLRSLEIKLHTDPVRHRKASLRLGLSYRR